MCSGLWNILLRPTKCKFLDIVITVGPLGSWFYPYLDGFPCKKNWNRSFYSCWLTVFSCSALIAIIYREYYFCVLFLFPTTRILFQHALKLEDWCYLSISCKLDICIHSDVRNEVFPLMSSMTSLCMKCQACNLWNHLMVGCPNIFYCRFVGLTFQAKGRLSSFQMGHGMDPTRAALESCSYFVWGGLADAQDVAETIIFGGSHKIDDENTTSWKNLPLCIVCTIGNRRNWRLFRWWWFFCGWGRLMFH